MWNYFARRLLLAVVTLFFSTMIVFAIIDLAPGGPVERIRMQLLTGGGGGGEGGGGRIEGSGAVSEKQLESYKRYYNLDKPLYKRYLLWLAKLIVLDFGDSIKYERPVWTLLKERFPISISLGIIGFVLSYSVCIPLGIMKGVKHNTAFDFMSSVIVFLGYAIPGWVLGVLILKAFASAPPEGLGWLPVGGFRPTNWAELSFTGKVKAQILHAILPVVAYMAGSFATLTVLTKNSLMENLGQDYVRTAFAKGLPERKVIVVHAMRNSLIPLATGLGHIFSIVLAGSFLIEKVFQIPGMGMLGYEAVLDKDQNIIMGILVISTALTLLGNIMQDLLYCIFDPRIRFK